jgi:PTH1 family peptidyl-tRNA hydrolase
VSSAEVWLVVGLGNPGSRYALTRHNIGYLVLDELADRMDGTLRAHRSRRADVLEGRLEIGGPRVVLGRARSYMNESGGPVKALAEFYKVASDHLVVVHDEVDLPFGSLRVKFAGGDNGHNGLRSIRGALGTGEFYRVRLGVGRPQGQRATADHVLSQFSAQERAEISEQCGRAADAVTSLVVEGLERTQSRYNS